MFGSSTSGPLWSGRASGEPPTAWYREHTEEVLQEAGYSPADIEHLRAGRGVSWGLRTCGVRSRPAQVGTGSCVKDQFAVTLGPYAAWGHWDVGKWGRRVQLKDKIALVTGGTSGIGRAVAELFAEEGAAVTLTGRRRELGQEVVTGIRAKSGQADFVEMDVRQLPEVRALIEETAGRQDASTSSSTTPVSRCRVPSWPRAKKTTRTFFETNVRSMFFATKWAAELMVRQGSGSIVSIASVSGIAARKSARPTVERRALCSITRAAALELAPGVRVNAVSPGAVDTPLLRNARFPDAPNQDELVGGGRQPARWPRWPARRHCPRCPLSCLDEAGWVTGTNLVIDGGAHALLTDLPSHPHLRCH